jgi:hypothetical protein
VWRPTPIDILPGKLVSWRNVDGFSFASAAAASRHMLANIVQ